MPSDRRWQAAGAAAPLGRRAAMSKLAATSLVGGATLLLGAAVAAFGRRFGHQGATVTGPTFPTSPAGSGTPSTTVGGTGTPPSTTGTGAPAPKGKRLGPATAVTVGGAVGFTDPFQGIPAYVVQPKAGEYLGFSAVCTHAGCTVSFVQSVEQFQCPCHGSIYSASTGAVLGGPAPSPLPSIGVEVSGGELYVTD